METTADDLYDIALTRLDGSPSSLRDFAGKVLLAVNVASRCGLTPQYAGLQALYESLRGRGFEVLGFPCNQFGAQEPGTSAEIAEFCTSWYGVSFPMFSKLDVNGSARHPLYRALIAAQPGSADSSDVSWNFEKFLIDRRGNAIARFSPRTTPDDPELRARIESALAE